MRVEVQPEEGIWTVTLSRQNILGLLAKQPDPTSHPILVGCFTYVDGSDITPRRQSGA